MALKEKILDRAQKFIQKGYIEKALIEYKAAADIDPRDISIRLRIGDLYVKMGRKPEAIKEYTEVAKANSQRGFYLKAIAVYKQVLKLDEGNLEVHYKLAELYTKQRLMADAIGAYSVIVSSFEKKGKTSEVMELLKKMIEVDPENVGVRLKLADLYQKLSFDKDALIEYNWIFNKLVTQGQFDKAEKIYLGLYHSRAREAGILEGLADLYKKRNDENQFIRFSKNLFEVYKSAGDNANASAVCRSILETRPDDSESLRFLKSISRPESKEAPSKPIEKAEAPLLEFPQVAVEIKYEEPLKAEVAAPEQAPRAADVETPLISWPEEEIEISLEGFGEGEEQKFEEAFRRE
ncbi:MAG: tetratricopeptide repeat protein, partial [Deltaproteobacteria bacterium]|nr:tetratricopeptide repeat protein [Deltaproteobacteria bacterium]